MKELSEKYFCIYGGGSIRGIAYIGAMQAMNELGIERVGYAGSSVGAIVAMLDAFAYTTDEICSLLDEINIELFKDINISFGYNIALSKGKIFYNFIKELIEKKFYGEKYDKQHNKPVCFKDVDKDLIIITTNFNNATYKEFSRYTTPDFEIAKAIRISATIPGFLKSIEVENDMLVDGDVLKSVPTWTLANSLCPDNHRVLEFRLEGETNVKQIKNIVEYLNALISNISNFATKSMVKKYKDKDKFDCIVLTTQDVALIDFNLSQEKRQQLIKYGYNETYNYFLKTLKVKKTHLIKYYKLTYSYMRQFQERINSGKYQQLKTLMGELFIELAFINRYIDSYYYKLIIEFKDCLFKNLSRNVLGFYKLDNKEFLNTQLTFLNTELWRTIKEMEEYAIKTEETDA